MSARAEIEAKTSRTRQAISFKEEEMLLFKMREMKKA